MKKLNLFLLVLFPLLIAVPLFAEGSDEKVNLTVDQAVDYAIEHSFTVQSVRLDLETQKDTTNHVLNALLPTVQIGMTAARSNTYSTTYADLLNPIYNSMGYSGLPTSASSEADYWTAIGNLSISLNYNGSILADFRKASSDYEAGLITYDEKCRQTKRDIKKVFYSLLLEQETLKINQLSLDSTKEQYELSRISYKNGYITELQLLQLEVNLRNQETALSKSQQKLDNELMEFAVLLGFPVNTKIQITGTMNKNTVDFDKWALTQKYGAQNSDWILINNNITSLDNQILSLNLKTFTPTFSFNYGFKPSLYDFDSNWFDANNWTDAGNMSFTISWDLTSMLPFSTASINRNKLQRQKEKLVLQKDYIQSSIWNQIYEIMNQIDKSEETISDSKENLTLAQKSYDLTLSSYKNGTSEYLLLKDAETQLNKARLSYETDLYNYNCSIIDMEYLLNLPDNWQIENSVEKNKTLSN